MKVNSKEKVKQLPHILSTRNVLIFIFQLLEYTLFQPGLFLEYLAAPYKTAKHLEPLGTMIDFQNQRAIVVDGHDPFITFTTVQNVATAVARAVDLDGEWPAICGISGNRVSISQILEIGEKIRGGS